VITRYILILGFELFCISAQASFKLVQDMRVARVHLRLISNVVRGTKRPFHFLPLLRMLSQSWIRCFALKFHFSSGTCKQGTACAATAWILRFLRAPLGALEIPSWFSSLHFANIRWRWPLMRPSNTLIL